MATSLEQVQTFLDEFDLRYQVDRDYDAILIAFGLDPETTQFRDADGDPSIHLVIRLLEQGEYLAVFCPRGWNLTDCPHEGAVLEAATAIQGRYKMLRFDYDPTDGELRPNIELPLEDAPLTSRQFHRVGHGMLHGLQRFDGVIRHAMQTGEVSFAFMEADEPDDASMPAITRLQQLAVEAGGIDELERIASGCGANDDESLRDRDEEPARPTARTEPSDPTPVLRMIWERIFGTGRRDSGTGLRAG